MTTNLKAALDAAEQVLFSRRHMHRATQDDPDTCITCGRNFRDDIHFRSGESPHTDKMKLAGLLPAARAELEALEKRAEVPEMPEIVKTFVTVAAKHTVKSTRTDLENIKAAVVAAERAKK